MQTEERCFKSAQCMHYIYFYHQHKLLESFFRKSPTLYQNADRYAVVLLLEISASFQIELHSILTFASS